MCKTNDDATKNGNKRNNVCLNREKENFKTKKMM